MMRVDEARHDNVTFEVENFVGSSGKVSVFFDLLDETVTDKKTTIRQFGLVVIHGEQIGVFDEKGGHSLLAFSF
jgi:hypothetical protein